jgi:hypothetical protein
MKRIVWSSYLAILLLSSGLWAENEGTFRGDLVRVSQGKQAAEAIYLQGRDGNVRCILVARAAIVYDEAAASADQKQAARLALVPGTEVRVTAQMDAQSGEWTASRVEIIPGHAAAFEDDYGEDGSGPDPVTAESTPASDRRVI